MATALAKGTPGAPTAFRKLATDMARNLLEDWVGKERAGEATGRIAAALSSAAASAKKPEDFYECTPTSIANCVAISALTGIMPGVGGAALAYLVPRSPRRGEQKQLVFMFSHRGLNVLASRSGQTMIAIPISYTDSISITGDGEVVVDDVDFDNPPTTFEELRGVVVVVKRIESGVVVARGWMPKVLIEKRRDGSDAYSFATQPGKDWAKDSDPWHKWPVEMAMKTAMHYAVSRGWCVIDDTATAKALSYDSAIDVTPVKPPTMLEGPRTLDQLADNLSKPVGTVSHVGLGPEDETEEEAEPETVNGEIMEEAIEGEAETEQAQEQAEQPKDPLAGVTDRMRACKTKKQIQDIAKEVRASHQLSTGDDMRLDSFTDDFISAL